MTSKDFELLDEAKETLSGLGSDDGHDFSPIRLADISQLRRKSTRSANGRGSEAVGKWGFG
jgi:hypothetical protein